MTSRQGVKGNKFERECVEYLRAHGFSQAARTLAGARDDRADISGIPNAVIQCKNHNRLALAEWVDESMAQMENAGVTRSFVFHKRKGVTDIARMYATTELWLAAELLLP